MNQHRPFRFGVGVGSAASRADWASLARKTEALGYSTLLLADHFVNDLPPIAALMAAADATRTLRIGSFVFANDFRHPVVLAKEAATLDLLSDGRFELGIGAGWHRTEYQLAGIPFEAPGVRLSRLEEAIQIIKRFFTEESVTFTGKHYTITDLPAMPKPVQRPHPPLLIGGGGKRVLTLAAREGDIIGFLTKVNPDETIDLAERTATALLQKVEWVQQSAGARFGTLELNALARVVITNDTRSAAETFARERGWEGVSAEQVLEMHNVLIGSVSEVVETIQQWRERCGISYIVIAGEEQVEPFAPVVARLAGK